MRAARHVAVRSAEPDLLDVRRIGTDSRGEPLGAAVDGAGMTCAAHCGQRFGGTRPGLTGDGSAVPQTQIGDLDGHVVAAGDLSGQLSHPLPVRRFARRARHGVGGQYVLAELGRRPPGQLGGAQHPHGADEAGQGLGTRGSASGAEQEEAVAGRPALDEHGVGGGDAGARRVQARTAGREPVGVRGGGTPPHHLPVVGDEEFGQRGGIGGSTRRGPRAAPITDTVETQRDVLHEDPRRETADGAGSYFARITCSQRVLPGRSTAAGTAVSRFAAAGTTIEVSPTVHAA